MKIQNTHYKDIRFNPEIPKEQREVNRLIKRLIKLGWFLNTGELVVDDYRGDPMTETDIEEIQLHIVR
jgi:hypothetical protein